MRKASFEVWPLGQPGMVVLSVSESSLYWLVSEHLCTTSSEVLQETALACCYSALHCGICSLNLAKYSTIQRKVARTRTQFPYDPGMLTAHWLSKANLVALLPAPSDTIAAPSKMAAATADPGAGNPQAGDSSGGDSGGGLPSPGEQELSRRLQRLYPAVNQHETPLPRSWSPKDKYNYIGLSQGNLRVHYKGISGSGRWETSPERLQGGCAHYPFLCSGFLRVGP